MRLYFIENIPQRSLRDKRLKFLILTVLNSILPTAPQLLANRHRFQFNNLF